MKSPAKKKGEKKAQAGAQLSKADHAKVAAVLDEFARGWREADAAVLASTWMQDDSTISYQASEQPAPLYGMAALRKYYKEALGMYPITSMEIRNVRIVPVGTAAYASCDIDIGFVVSGKEYVVHPRATFVLRKRGSRWFVVHYHESIKYEVPG